MLNRHWQTAGTRKDDFLGVGNGRVGEQQGQEEEEEREHVWRCVVD